MPDRRTNAETIISITIRPPILEFPRLSIPMTIFLQYIDDSKYLVSLEKGSQKEGAFNHYQIYLRTVKNINTIRKAVNRIFKGYLSPQTLKKNIWRKVASHNNKVSLLGYCQKEGNIFSTNIGRTILDAELKLYLEQTKDKTKLPCCCKNSKRQIKIHCRCETWTNEKKRFYTEHLNNWKCLYCNPSIHFPYYKGLHQCSEQLI